LVSDEINYQKSEGDTDRADKITLDPLGGWHEVRARRVLHDIERRVVPNKSNDENNASDEIRIRMRNGARNVLGKDEKHKEEHHKARTEKNVGPTTDEEDRQ
jgi:hypothetical protein